MVTGSTFRLTFYPLPEGEGMHVLFCFHLQEHVWNAALYVTGSVCLLFFFLFLFFLFSFLFFSYYFLAFMDLVLERNCHTVCFFCFL